MRPLSVLTLLVLALLLGVAAPANAARYVVDSPGDAIDRLADDGICATEAGTCTLRAALMTADDDGDRDRIEFAIPPGAVIAPASALPAITEPVELDGADMTGRPTIEIDGSRLAPTITTPGPSSFAINAPHGLNFEGADDVVVRGLIVHSFPGAQLHFRRLSGAVVAGNWLGLDAQGFLDRGREIAGSVDSAGILFTDVEQSRIGGELARDANVVSGLEHGIVVEGASSFVAVSGNRIGLTADGSGPIGNDHDGIAVGPRAGSSTRPSRIEIAANTIAATGFGSQAGGYGWAVRLAADDTTIAYNRIGFDGSGTHVRTFFSDPFGNRSAGVLVADALRAQVRHNKISANSVGVLAYGERLDGLAVAGNTIGLDADGHDALDAGGNPTGNLGPGVWIDGGRNVTVGGPAAIDANVIGGNRGSAIQLLGAMSAPVVQNNTIATDAARTVAVADALHGISVEPGESGAAPVAAEIRGNRIGGEPGHAVALFGGRDHVVAGNEIGLAADGSPLPGVVGVGVIDVPGVRVGGTTAPDANAIVAMRRSGVLVTGARASGTRVEGNFVGFDGGGATRPGYGNGDGVAVEERAPYGAPSGVRVGGERAVEGNMIGGSGSGAGVHVSGRETAGTLVGWNRIGAGATGTPAPNDVGVRVDRAPGTAIGAPGAGNILQDAGRWAIAISGRGAGRRVQGNEIRRGDDGGAPPAGRGGVLLDDASGVVVGAARDAVLASDCATGECNDFGANGRAAIVVTGEGDGNVLRGNRFSDASAQPIDLGGDGPSALDARDLDGGPNLGLNQPTGVQETWDPRTRRFAVTGVVESHDPRGVAVELYGQEGSDGRPGTLATLLGRVRPDSRGAFRLWLPEGTRFSRYTALAHSDDGTSEFAVGCGFRSGATAADDDRDGICDEWERIGVDYDQDGTLDFDPRGEVGRRDLHVELDAMERGAADVFDPAPEVATLTRVAEPFRQSPVGPIELHWMGEPGLVRGERVPAAAGLSVDRRPGPADDLADYRWGRDEEPCDGWFGTAAERADDDGRCFARLGARGLVVRYVLSTGRIAPVGGTTPPGISLSNAVGVVGLAGMSEQTARLQAAGTRECAAPRGCQQAQYAYVLMHELGHMLGLPHDGGDGADPSERRGSAHNPAHLSVMSYVYADAWHRNPLDYAATDGLVLDESQIDEAFPFALRPADAARGWRPLLTAWRGIGSIGQCMPVLVPNGRPTNLDDDPHEQKIAHGLNDAGDASCLRPPEGRRERFTGGEEWSRLQLSTRIGFDLFDDVVRDPEVTAGTAPARRPGRLAPAPVPAPLAEAPGEEIAAAADLDEDGIPASSDVCPGRPDPGQADADGDGIGDACVEDHAPSDLELRLDAPRLHTAGADAEVAVHVTEAWPFATGAATVAVELPEGLTVVGASGDGAFDAATGRWSTGGFAARERRTLRLTVRAAEEAAGEGTIGAEIVAAAAEDVDSTPGDGSPEQDDRARRAVELVPPVEPSRLDLRDARAVEGSAGRRALRFAVRFDPDTPNSVSFRVRTTGGSATAGEDYEPVDRVVTVPAGSAEAEVAVATVPDAHVEDDETVELTIDQLDGATAGRMVATGTIADDDRRAPGDLTAFGCIARRDLRDRCTIETLGFRHDNRGIALAGERDLYLTDGVAIAHLRRDPATETLTPAGCWRVRTTEGDVPAAGCDDLPEDEQGRLPFEATDVMRLTAAPDGRHLYAALGTHRVGYGVATFAIDPDSGALTLVRCVGDPTLGPGCSGGSGTVSWSDGDWPTTSIAPDGRTLTFAAGRWVRILRIGDDGVAGPFRCGDTGALATESACAPLAADGPLQRQAISSDGTRLALTGWDRVQVFRRDSANGTLAQAKAIETAPTGYGAAAWTPDGGTLLVSSQRGSGAIVAYDPETLEPTGCIAGDGGGPWPAGLDCSATAPVDLSSVGGLRFAPDGRDLYAVGAGGGVVAFRHDGDGRLRFGRCNEPASDAGLCAEEDAGGAGHANIDLAIDPAGAVAFAAAGGDEVNRYLRVQPPAPGGNRAPFCDDASVSGRPSGAIAVPLACADPDGDAVAVRITGAPARGTLGEPAGAVVAYTPAPDLRGTDEFRFRGSDGRAESPDATVRLAIGNAPPTCSRDRLALRPGTVARLPLQCADADGDPLAIEILSGPSHGRLEGPERLDYAAPSDWAGETAVTVRASDGFDRSEPVTVAISVEGDIVQQPPRPRTGADDRDDGGRSGGGSRSGGSGSGGGSGGCRAPCTPGSDGAVEITVLCDGARVATGATCRGTLVIVMCSNGLCRRSRGSAVAGAAGAPRKLLPSVRGLRLGQGQVRVKPGRRARLRVKLTRAARRQLARRGSLKALVVVQVRRPGGRVTTDRTVITIRARRAPPRKRGAV